MKPSAAAKMRSLVAAGMASAAAERLRTSESVVGERFRRLASSLRLMGGVTAELAREFLAALARERFAAADFLEARFFGADFMDAEFFSRSTQREKRSASVPNRKAQSKRERKSREGMYQIETS